MVIAQKLAVISVMIGLDVVTGFAKAMYKHNYSSSLMRAGAYHKISEFMVVLLSVLADMYLPIVGLNLGVSITPFVVTYFSIMEATSIIENIGEINPDAVAPIKKFFEKLKDEDDK